jgi:hypothetical protein
MMLPFEEGSLWMFGSRRYWRMLKNSVACVSPLATEREFDAG